MMSVNFGSIIRALKENRSDASSSDSMAAGIKWLLRAYEATPDGGVSIRFSLMRGWESSYPETTGYIIPTFLRYSEITGDMSYRDRAVSMADWELAIQQDDGSFIGGAFREPVGKLVFDTGQIMFGLICAYELTGDNKYIVAAIKAGEWLLRHQDSDGAWRTHSFNSIPHTYHSRVAWPLAELWRVTGEQRYADGAKRHFEWVLANQTSNGWFENAGFTNDNNKAPYTHTIAYTLRGLLEAGVLLGEDRYIDAVRRSVDGILAVMDASGMFQGTYDRNWKGDRRFSCLTGNAQISLICSKLFMILREGRYSEATGIINSFLKTKQNITTSDADIFGAIPGSSPLWGEYERLAFPNWATKFFLDALWAETECDSRDSMELRERLSFKYPG